MFGDPEPGRDVARRLDFHVVPLAVAERQGVGLESLRLCDRQGRRRIETAAEQHDCLFVSHCSSFVSTEMGRFPVIGHRCQI